MDQKYTHKKHTQKQLTAIFAELSGQTRDKLQNSTWINPLNDQSLRLSMEGYQFLVFNLKFKAYKFILETPLLNKNLLQLERYYPGMYFILKNQYLYLFDEDQASYLTLLGNDVKAYLRNLEINS